MGDLLFVTKMEPEEFEDFKGISVERDLHELYEVDPDDCLNVLYREQEFFEELYVKYRLMGNKRYIFSRYTGEIYEVLA